MFSIGAKRVVVMILAVAVIIIGVGNVSVYNDLLGLVLAIMCIVGGVYGLIGAWYMHPVHLGFFLITLLVLSVLQAVFIIYMVVHHNGFISFLVWNIATLCLLLLGAAFTADLRRAIMGYDTIADPLMHPGSGASVVV